MPPRAAAARGRPSTGGTQGGAGTQAGGGAGGSGGAGPSNRNAEPIPDYVTFTVIQALMPAGAMLEDDVKAMVRRLMKANSDAHFQAALSKIGEDTGFLDLAIERIKLPATNKWYLCVVNKLKDSASMTMGSHYTPDQLSFYRAVVEAISSAAPDGGCVLAEVSSVELVNLDVGARATQAAGGDTQAGTQAAKPKRLSMAEKQTLLGRLAAEGWLHATPGGTYTLGPRTLSELKDFVLGTVSAEVAQQLQTDYM
ncbi:hypothetical protein HYH03_002231 [Edaphochlamys debaryana]|uniref:Non-structural maintenance of chromosomes element 1 homolog n=1 Tax=Edaphochlamys debaryana TaxID=47281 RepID=A0A836C5K6_9CHLO|nr:hypothetical protein HYH03_002231 [Edaphochlamys debaryana]|eukprot:KAG2499944.1 hypothetical protein HYH03_002231 [Edaphochlamys debaryana]